MISKTIGFRGTQHFQTHPNIAYRTGCANVNPEGVDDWIYLTVNPMIWCKNRFFIWVYFKSTVLWWTPRWVNEASFLSNGSTMLGIDPSCGLWSVSNSSWVSLLKGSWGGIYHPSHWSGNADAYPMIRKCHPIIPWIPRYFECVSTKMGPRKNHPFLFWLFYNKPSMFGIPHLWKPTYFQFRQWQRTLTSKLLGIRERSSLCRHLSHTSVFSRF